MSQAKIKTALEAALTALNPAIQTASENLVFEPVAGSPYQVVSFLFAQPENPTLGDGFYRERGIMQVSLRWPAGEGDGAITAHAEAIRAGLHRGLSISRESVTTVIDRTPEIGSGSTDGNRYVINVRIRFFANIQGA